MRTNSTLNYILGDHASTGSAQVLGSTSLAVDASMGEAIETRYKPWCEVRYTTPNKTLPTQYTFTGQYSYVADEATDLGSAGFGLLFYNARFYDPAVGRFISADSIVPGGVQGYDRYAYTNNNPLRYTDPSGHRPCGDGEDINCDGTSNDPAPNLPGCGGEGQQSCGGVPNNDDEQEQDDPTPATTINFWPDYWIGSLFVPVYPPFPIFGINLSVIIDAYGNIYFNGGGGFVFVGYSVNGGGGWFLGPDNDNQEFAESFLQGHSFNVSGGAGPGIGVNNVNPSYIQSGNEGSGIENISIEGLITSPGITAVFSYGWLIYDNGDDTPWIWQGD